MTLTDYLRETRQTQMAFAARLGVSASTISRLCRGETAPEAGLVTKIVAATEGRVLPNDLFPAAMQAASRPVPSEAA